MIVTFGTSVELNSESEQYGKPDGIPDFGNGEKPEGMPDGWNGEKPEGMPDFGNGEKPEWRSGARPGRGSEKQRKDAEE